AAAHRLESRGARPAVDDEAVRGGERRRASFRLRFAADARRRGTSLAARALDRRGRARAPSIWAQAAARRCRAFARECPLPQVFAGARSRMNFGKKANAIPRRPLLWLAAALVFTVPSMFGNLAWWVPVI